MWRSTLAWSATVAHTLGRGMIAAPAGLRGDMAEVERQQRRWGESILRAAHIDIEVVGRQHVHAQTPYVVVANHASSLDPPVLFSGLPIGMTYVAKVELLKVPVFGPIIARTGAVFVPRGDHGQAQVVLERAAERVRAGQNVLVFAEGTRSLDGHLLPFKKGAFVLAIAAQAEILPVTIVGTRDLMPSHAIAVHPGRVQLHIHPPIPTAGLEYADRDRLREHTRATIAAALPANLR